LDTLKVGENLDVAGNPLSASVRVAPPKPISKPE
jgi:hypothetical protein